LSREIRRSPGGYGFEGGINYFFLWEEGFYR
jgi:hypothetical protein